MPYDYSSLLKNNASDFYDTWEDIYIGSLSLPANFELILRQSLYLPYDHYKIIAAYAFIPSVFARIVPYMFFWGVSGSGKSTTGKLIAKLHGVQITSSGDTFAAIRNSLSDRKRVCVEIPTTIGDLKTTMPKEVEGNAFMVWDDIDPSIFTTNVDIYRLFKFGYDKSCDTIEVSSEETGKNIKFRCFCPKVFSSIHALHLQENLKELRRRLIVIPTKRIEDLTSQRRQELEIDNDKWEDNLIDVDNINWAGFEKLFADFWSLELAQLYLQNRQMLTKYIKGLNSQERAISIDLITTGVTTGIWNDEDEAIADVKRYWKWFRGEINIGESPLVQLLKKLVKEEASNAKKAGVELFIGNQQVKASCEMWMSQGYLLDKPNSKTIKAAMAELGFRLVYGGKWIKS